jgi:hypothetical protein
VITEITAVTEINTKQDMSRWTRAHEKVQGIHWSVFAGPGGTMIIVEYEEDRAALYAKDASPETLGSVPSLADGASAVGVGGPAAFLAAPSWPSPAA